MNGRRTPDIRIHTFGIPTLVMMFAALCLIVLSVLSLSSARNDYDHSQTAASHRSAYYEACSSSEEVIAGLCRGDTLQEAGRMKDGKTIDIIRKSDTYSWSVPAGRKQELHVEAVISGGGCEINKWQIVTKGGSDES